MYITIFGKVEGYDDASYERDVETEKPNGEIVKSKETVPQMQLALRIPDMKDLVKVTFPQDKAPSPQTGNQWEDQNTWVKAIADSYSMTTGVRKGKAWGVLSFRGEKAEVATDIEVKTLNDARRKAKAAAKAKKDAERQAKLKAAG